jgi:neutral ceramidase
MRNASDLSLKRVIVVVAVICFTLSFTVLPARAADSGGTLRAGTAKIDITPDKPVKMAGYGARKALSTDVHDPLSARVVVFENDGRRLVLVSSDLIGYYGGTAEQFRQVILDKFQLKPSELFLSAIHDHDGPALSLDKERGHPNNIEYTKNLQGKLVEVIGKALGNMQPVRIGTGVGYSSVGVNRRQLVFDRAGHSSIRLGCNPYGPTDKEVLVMKLAKPDGTTYATLFDYATHATCLGGRNLTISGDVIGLAEQFVEKILGEEVIAGAFAGASGNIDPAFRVLPAFNTEPGWIPEPVLLGTLLGEEVVHVFRDIKDVSDGGDIRSAFVTLDLPAKPRDPDEKEKESRTVSLNISAARIGDIGFVGLGGEVLTEIGMSIKAASPFEHTFVITHCNGAAGYLPPKQLYVEGGYEVESTRFGPRAAEMVVKQAVKMLHEL